MEFILHLPQDIDKNGALWEIWSSFCQNLKFVQNVEFQEEAFVTPPSLLLFAANDQVNSICSSLKMYNLDLPQLNQILQVVEQACLPYFILLFERFRYFSFKREPSDSLDDFCAVLRKQAELCEFGNLKDSMLTNAIDSSMKRESLVQQISTTDELQFDDITDNVDEIEKSQTTNVKDDSALLVKDSPHEKKGKHKQVIGKQTKKSNVLKAKKKTRGAVHSKVEKHKHVEDGGDSDFENNDEDTAYSSNEVEAKLDSSRKSSTKVVTTIKTEAEVIVPSKFYCCFCTKNFTNPYRLKRHWIIHKDNVPFKCKMCTDEFVSCNDYVLHYKTEHYVKIHNPRNDSSLKTKGRRGFGKCNCSVCRGGLVKEGCLKHIHDSHTNNFMCWNCGENFPNLQEYKQHGEKHALIGKFTCEYCQKRHHNVFRLIGHLKNHLMPQNKCEICGVIFIKPESLTKHIKRHLEEPAHICEICGKNFVTEGRLQSHMRIHTGEKRFTCELCGKMYANKNNLLDHRRWHAGEKPFVCEICGTQTRSSGDMSKHKRKHINKRSYVCEVCGRGFNFSHALAKHRLGHTGKRSFACKDCGRTYIYREGLMDHIKAQRCPVGRESGFKRTPKPKKLLKSGISTNLMDVVESEVFVPAHAQRAADGTLKDTQDWLCVLSNNETEVATSVLVVSSLY